jgi:hypothetical protein
VPAVAAAAVRQDERLNRSTTDEAFTFGVREAEPQWGKNVRDRAIREAAALAAVGGEPGHEALKRLAVEFGQPRVRLEVAEGEGGQQAPVFAPCPLADRVVAEARVAVDPAQRVVAQRRPEALGPRLRLAGYLDRPCLREARHRLFALPPVSQVDGDVAAATPVDARMRGTDQRFRSAFPLPRCRQCCHTWDFDKTLLTPRKPHGAALPDPPLRECARLDSNQ